MTVNQFLTIISKILKLIFSKAAASKLLQLLNMHQEDCPQFIIPYYAMMTKVSAAVGFEEEHDFIMGPGFDHYSHVAIQL
jgi:hypothetical protein